MEKFKNNNKEEFYAEEEIVNEPSKSKKRRGFKFWIGLLILIVAAVALGSYFDLFPAQFFPGYDDNSYQAVFLDNSQVYFGKFQRGDERFADLKDVYYLQVSQTLQPAQQGTSNINLVKLGGELHGPTDEMRISYNSIVFVENLKPDSVVLKAILQQKTPAKK